MFECSPRLLYWPKQRQISRVQSQLLSLIWRFPKSKTSLQPHEKFTMPSSKIWNKIIAVYTLACFIYFDTEISVMGPTEISILECTDRNFCTPHYRNFCVKVDETSFCEWFILQSMESKFNSKYFCSYIRVQFRNEINQHVS